MFITSTSTLFVLATLLSSQIASTVAHPLKDDPSLTRRAGTCADVASGLINCATCVGTTDCVFDSVKLKCLKKSKQTTDAKFFTASTQCQAAIKATPEGRADDLFSKLKPHIHGTEPGQSATSGRHTLKAFRAGKGNDKAKKPGKCDKETDLCVFEPLKTVFGNSYTDAEIERICKTAIKANGSNQGLLSTVVASGKAGINICIAHQTAGVGSCFPTGIGKATGDLGAVCIAVTPPDTETVTAP